MYSSHAPAYVEQNVPDLLNCGNYFIFVKYWMHLGKVQNNKHFLKIG